MKIGIACDHNGLKLREEIIKYLKEKKYYVVDYGPKKLIPTDDYPDYAFKLGEAVANHEIDYGILICCTGIGMSIACNKVKGVRCAKVNSIWETRLTRTDNDSNVITINQNLSIEKIKKIIDTFLTTPFSTSERHHRRVEKIMNYER